MMDESTHVESLSQLMCFFGFVVNGTLYEELLFCTALEESYKSVDVFRAVNLQLEAVSTDRCSLWRAILFLHLLIRQCRWRCFVGSVTLRGIKADEPGTGHLIFGDSYWFSQERHGDFPNGDKLDLLELGLERHHRFPHGHHTMVQVTSGNI